MIQAGQCGRACVPLSRNVRLCTVNKRLDIGAPIDTVRMLASFHPKYQNCSWTSFRIEYNGKFIRDYLASGDRYGNHCYCQPENRMRHFDRHIYVWPCPILNAMVNVIHIFVFLYSRKQWQVGQTLLLPTHTVAYRLSIGIFTIDLGQTLLFTNRVAWVFSISKITFDLGPF